MTTIYDLLRRRCGLSQLEAAEIHGVPKDTVAAWCRGRYQPPDAVLKELADLYTRIERAASEALAEASAARRRMGGDPEVIELHTASTEASAKKLGWPCMAAQLACHGLLVARGLPKGLHFELVPSP